MKAVIEWNQLVSGDVVHFIDYSEDTQATLVIHGIERSGENGTLCGTWTIEGSADTCVNAQHLTQNGTYLGHMNLEWAKLLYG